MRGVCRDTLYVLIVDEAKAISEFQMRLRTKCGFVVDCFDM